MASNHETSFQSADVLIAGGGVIGSACAYFLMQQQGGWGGRVVVVEPDPSYRHAASALSASSIRQQFSSPINVRISQFGIEFLRALEAGELPGGEAADVGLVESTYLYLATDAGLPTLARNVVTQEDCGVDVTLHTTAELAARYPWLTTSDLVAGADTQDCEGWFDGYALLRALRQRAEVLGAVYIRDRVSDVGLHGDRVAVVRFESGRRCACGSFVNATGTASALLARQAGIELPVRPRKRCVFVFTCAAEIADCPLVIDPSGLWFRPEGDRYLCGLPPEPDPDVALDDFDVAYDLYERVAWPALAARVPAFEAIRYAGAWAGHYDYNVFDQNAFVGRHPEIGNFLLASGFSGHGMQQAPAVGRALAELIALGHYSALDFAPLGYHRFLANAPLVEHNII
jgi:FAD-dependent oxidoreductase domain-containing protein 1